MAGLCRGFLLLSAAVPFLAVECRGGEWPDMSDVDFVKQYASQAAGDDLAGQSAVAWMLFARVNKPSAGDPHQTQWESWPSNDDTFSPAVRTFSLEQKVRVRPHLQEPKAELLEEGMKKAHGFSGPRDVVKEEVTRNLISYKYITDSGLNTTIGLSRKLESSDPKVNFPIGATEIKAAWVPRAIEGAYQTTDSTQKPPVVYSLVGLHIMTKFAPAPDKPFSSEDASWFWTTFEFKGNPGLANAQSLLTYKDALPSGDVQDVLKKAGLGSTPFQNYKCNGTQIRYSDAKNAEIRLGNTKMEDFSFVPASAPDPSRWTQWNISCHTCHGETCAKITDHQLDIKYFSGSNLDVGKIPASDVDGYSSLDFVWSISRFAR